MMFRKGDVLKAEGLDDNCNPAEIKVIFTRYLKADDISEQKRVGSGSEMTRLDCVVFSEGLHVKAESKGLRR